MVVEINNLTESKIDEKKVRSIIEKVLILEKAEGDVSVAFLGPGRMRKLNKQYRNKNKVTDVLSFAEKEVVFEKYKIGKIQKTNGLGEIVVCPREIKKSAKNTEKTFEEELALVLIHGTLHLLGYEHENQSKKEKEIRNKEKVYLSKI